MQEKLISGFDTNELAGTIASIQITPGKSSETIPTTSSSKTPLDDSSGTGESETSLPPIQPGPRKPRRLSRGGLSGEDGPTDKIDIDSENIETPPVTRRAYGSRPFVGTGTTSTSAGTTEVSSPTSCTTSSTNGRTSMKAEDDELGDGRFDRFSSVRRTRRLRKAPEGAEEDCLEPRKSPEGVEDPEDLSQPDVIVGMEVKKVRFLIIRLKSARTSLYRFIDFRLKLGGKIPVLFLFFFSFKDRGPLDTFLFNTLIS